MVAGLAACGPGPARGPPPLRSETTLGLIEARTDLDGARIGVSTAPATLAFVFASWCSHCHEHLAELATLRAAHPRTRILGVSYRGHEEYDGRGNPTAVRAYLAKHAPWLRVLPADEVLFAALGRPRFVPTLYIFDARGALVVRYDRGAEPLPSAAALGVVLTRLARLARLQ